MAKYCVIRTDLMAGTKNPDQLVSLRYYADEAVAEVSVYIYIAGTLSLDE